LQAHNTHFSVFLRRTAASAIPKKCECRIFQTKILAKYFGNRMKMSNFVRNFSAPGSKISAATPDSRSRPTG
jgi:hypothetical protein